MLLLVASAAAAPVAQQPLRWGNQKNNTYKNPILNADYSDPDVCRVGDDYYMTASSFNCLPGLGDTAAEKIVAVAKANGSEVSGPIPLPTEREIVTILRSVHVNKDSREQFETRTHKRLIDIMKPSQKTVDALMSIELPAGVEIEVKL